MGKPVQLQQFLELNSAELAGAKALIDDSADFAAYKAAGFNLLLGDTQLDKPPDFKLPKTMSAGKWWQYIRNVRLHLPVNSAHLLSPSLPETTRVLVAQVGQLAPVSKDINFGEVPAGVKVLGGTYAIDNSAVTFSHMDEVPGATPEIEDVLKAVGA